MYVYMDKFKRIVHEQVCDVPLKQTTDVRMAKRE